MAHPDRKNESGLVINGTRITPQAQLVATGDYFQSASFAYNTFDGGSQYVSAIKIENGTQRCWDIQQVFVEREPNGKTTHTVTPQHTCLTYYEALYYCASFEAAKRNEQWYEAGQNGASLGLTHYIAFACAEMEGKTHGVVFDADGLPRPAIHGRPAAAATYEAEALEKAAGHAAREAGTLRKSWAEQAIEGLLPGVAQPASIEEFMADAKKLALIEKMVECGAKIEAALKTFSTYFDTPVQDQNVEAFIANTKTGSMSAAFANAARGAHEIRKEIRNSGQRHADSEYGYRSRYGGRDHDRHRYDGQQFLTVQERRDALSGALAKGNIDPGGRLTLERLIKYLETDTRSIKDSITAESKAMGEHIAVLRDMGCETRDFERFQTLLDFTFKYFKAKAAVNYARTHTGEKRLGALEELTPLINEAKQAFGKLGGQSDPKTIEGLILSASKPDIPVFIHLFLDQYEEEKRRLGSSIASPELAAQAQLSLPLEGGMAGFLPLKEEKGLVHMIREALELEAHKVTDNLFKEGVQDGRERERQRRQRSWYG